MAFETKFHCCCEVDTLRFGPIVLLIKSVATTVFLQPAHFSRVTWCCLIFDTDAYYALIVDPQHLVNADGES